MGKSGFSTSSGSILEAQASALFEALKLAVSRGFQTVHLETDDKTLADPVYSNSIHLNEFGDIISQSRDILSTNTNFIVLCIRRQVNAVAVVIAILTLIFYNVPTTLYSLIITEMN